MIQEYLKKEKHDGGIIGPFPLQGMAGVHINRIGAIPKKHQPGKWRIITDLSFPDGWSVNDAISPQLCSLSYITVDEVAAVAVALGPGSLMAKN